MISMIESSQKERPTVDPSLEELSERLEEIRQRRDQLQGYL